MNLAILIPLDYYFHLVSFVQHFFIDKYGEK